VENPLFHFRPLNFFPFPISSRLAIQHCHWFCWTSGSRKQRCIRWNFNAIYLYAGICETTIYEPPTYDLWLPVASENSHSSFIGLHNIKNIGVLSTFCLYLARNWRHTWCSVACNDISVVLTVSIRHFGFVSGARIVLIAPSCSPAIFRKSHQSASLKFQGYEIAAKIEAWGVFLPPPCVYMRVNQLSSLDMNK